VLRELGLADRADVPIIRLSGGQRKRASVAVELLTRPSLLFLDEPTSGLDPGFELSVMQLLRQLADGGRTVVVITHSVASLELCDRVLFLAPKGRMAYFGPPTTLLRFFGLARATRPPQRGAARGSPGGSPATTGRSGAAVLDARPA
jgi:ABC-type multidrug transport system ATPase subunit